MNVGSLYISSKGRNWLIFLDSNYMFDAGFLPIKYHHSTRYRRTLNAAKPPETSYTTLPSSVMFLACWLCRSNAHAFVICYHVSWHSVQDGSSHPHTCVLKCYCALHVHECYWINQIDEFLCSGWPQSNADIFNLDSHAIHNIILPLHMRYPCQSHFN